MYLTGRSHGLGPAHVSTLSIIYLCISKPIYIILRNIMSFCFMFGTADDLHTFCCWYLNSRSVNIFVQQPNFYSNGVKNVHRPKLRPVCFQQAKACRNLRRRPLAAAAPVSHHQWLCSSPSRILHSHAKCNFPFSWGAPSSRAPNKSARPGRRIGLIVQGKHQESAARVVHVS